ncbi:MAG TPA: sporulation protein [Natronosporangium sp.]
MGAKEILQQATESMTVRRVYAEPYERDGVTVIAGAVVSGGGGGGGGHDQEGREGDGGGFGLSARPAGAFVIKDGTVSWRPAVDLNRLGVLAAVVTVVYLVTRRRRR